MDAMIRLVLFASITCQLSVTVLALHLIRITGEKRSWALIAVASALMAARPGFVLLEWLFGKAHRLPDLWSELIALVISVLLLTGISHISAVILSLKRSREELLEKEDRIAAMVDNAADAFFVYDGAGRIIEANRNAWTTLGYSRSELLSLSLADIEKGQDPREVLALCSRMTPGTSLAVEGVHQRKDGSTFPVEIHLGTFESAGQKLYLALVHDSTERKRAEEELRLKSAALEASAKAVMITGRDGRIVWVNPAFTHLTGYAFDEAINLTPQLLMSGLQRKPFYRDLWNTILAGEVWHGELINQRKSGARYYEEETITPVKDEWGEIRYFVAIKQDISERKKAEKALLENATIRRDMKIARQIQRSFLPTRPPAIPGVQLAGQCVPAAHVGGDYYDFFTLEEGTLDVVIADVAGHSVGSALLMAEARSVLHATIHPRSSPGEILTSLNDLLHEDLERAELLISMFFLKLDTATGHFTFCQCGAHPAHPVPPRGWLIPRARR